MDIKKIDGHRHIVLLEAIAIAGKLNPVKSSHIDPSGLDARDPSKSTATREGIGIAK